MPTNQFAGVVASAPPIPIRLIPKDAWDWALFDKPGAERAAKDLSRELVKSLHGMGSRMSWRVPDKQNARFLHDQLTAIQRALAKYTEFGATDTEPRAHVRMAIQDYMEVLGLGQDDFPDTWLTFE